MSRMKSVVNFIQIPVEILREGVLAQLSLTDLCRLDTATLNHSLRPQLLHTFANLCTLKDIVLFPELIGWTTQKKIKPLRIKITEDVTFASLLRFTMYCPQLVKLDTRFFLYEVDDIQWKSRLHDDNDAEYASLVLNAESVVAILTNCSNLQELRLMSMQYPEEDWWQVLPQVIERCTRLHMLCYEDPEPDYCYVSFKLSRSSLSIFTTTDNPPVDSISLITTHYTALQQVTLYNDEDPSSSDEHILLLARRCKGLRQVAFRAVISSAAFAEFCRLSVNLVELRLHILSVTNISADTMRTALPHLVELQVFSYVQDRLTEHAIHRVAAESLPKLQILGVASTKVMSEDSWEYVFQNCPNLRRIESAAGCGTGNLRSLARSFGVTISKVAWRKLSDVVWSEGAPNA